MNLSNLIPIIVAIITAAGAIIAAAIGVKEKRRPPLRSKRVPASSRGGTTDPGMQPKEPEPARRMTVPIVSSLIFAAVFFGSLGYLLCLWKSADKPPSSKPEIKITAWPPPGNPGPGSHGDLKGTVSGSYPSGAWVLVYACVNGVSCYIQPVDTNYKIFPRPDGTWGTTTHLGDRYIASLVVPGFSNTPKELPNPPGGEGLLASDEKPATNSQ